MPLPRHDPNELSVAERHRKDAQTPSLFHHLLPGTQEGPPGPRTTGGTDGAKAHCVPGMRLLPLPRA